MALTASLAAPYGWRARVGLITPSPGHENNAYEFYLIAPVGVLPFSVTDKQAMANYQAWLGSLWFAPSALKNMAQADKLSSIYIPYWTYDAFTNSRYDGERGEYYYDTETFYENGDPI